MSTANHLSSVGLRPVLASACLVSLAALSACATTPPPTEQIAVARAAVDDAVRAGAGELAPAALTRAQMTLDRGNEAMAAQRYVDARRYAEDAEVDARLAAVTARSEKAQRAAVEVQQSIQALKDELARTTPR